MESAHRPKPSAEGLLYSMVRGIADGANLPLAGRASVGHIGLSGDVAEWLKAAVC
jgi:hypothetical protein